jgi:lipid II:glycine glycyltransferase (peptidoglycan interpeptide bridge formation enzyme)
MDTAQYDIQREGITEEEWSQLLGEFRDATLHQTWSSGRVQVGEGNLRHVVVRTGGDAVALAQVMLRKIPLIGIGVATVYWGPLWRRKDRPPDPGALEQILDVLIQEYALGRGYLLRVWPAAYDLLLAETGPERDVFARRGFKHNAGARPFETLMVDLTSSEDDLRKNLDHKWRNQLSAAEKAGLQLVHGTSDALYDRFSSLLREMIARKKFTTNVDYENYRRLQDDLPEPLKMHIFICERHGEAVAGGVYSVIGSMGMYLLGATAASGLKVNGSNLIQWNVMKWMKEHGCEVYDLGGIDPIGNAGVYKFKKGIAGKSGKTARHVGQFYAAATLRSRLLQQFLNRRTGQVEDLQRALKARFRARRQGHAPESRPA